MVKLGFVRLNLREIPKIEVARLAQICVPEHNHAAALITDCEVLARLVEVDGCEDVCVGDEGGVPLAQAIDVGPLGRRRLLRHRLLRLLRLIR